jgi:hypothetical protein
MTPDIVKGLYRIDVGDCACRSTSALAVLNVLEIHGVEAVADGESGTLLVVTDGREDLHDELVRAAVESGLQPTSVVVANIERIADPNPLSLEEAERLGLLAPPKVAVRAEMAAVQRVSVHVTDGYDPDTIIVAAGIPSELTFSEGHGCLGRVVFDALGIEADLENGGKVVRLPALTAGIYPFRCGRDIVHGTLIVE